MELVDLLGHFRFRSLASTFKTSFPKLTASSELQNFRWRLPEDVHGISDGSTSFQRFCIHVLTWLPLFLTILIVFRCSQEDGSQPNNGKAECVPSTSTGPVSHSMVSRINVPKRFVGHSIVIGFVTLLLALWIVLTILPNEIFPFWGWFLAYEWILFLHILLFGYYLKYCYETGKKNSTFPLPLKVNAFSPPFPKRSF